MAQAESSVTAAAVITTFNVLTRIVAIGSGLPEPLGVHYSAPAPPWLTASCPSPAESAGGRDILRTGSGASRRQQLSARTGQMDVVHFLKARLAIERDELDQLTSGSLRIHRRAGDGRFVDETDQSIARVKHLIDTLENQIKHFERQESSQQANR